MPSTPSLVKTWQFDVNQRISQSAVSTTVHQSDILMAIKDSLIGFASNPWTVQYSSNAGNNGAASAASGAAGVAGDGVDRWATSAAQGANTTCDINYQAAGSRHSWIVLRQTGLATNYEICIDCGHALAGQPGTVTVAISYSAGFTGGTATDRPTATDETVVINGGAIFNSATNVDHILHAWQSTDGACTRLMLWNGGSTNSALWIMDKVQDPPSGWTYPHMTLMLGNTAATYANLRNSSNCRSYGLGATPRFTYPMTGEWSGVFGSPNPGLLAEQSLISTQPNSFDGSWSIFPIGLASSAAGNVGRLGSMYDLWWRPAGANYCDTFPNDSSARRLVALGDLIFPWKNDSTVPLIA